MQPQFSRPISELGIYPAVDPLDSTSRILDPRYIGEHHFRVANRTKQILQRYKDLQDIIAILGIDELSEEDRILVGRARRIQRSFHRTHSWQRSSRVWKVHSFHYLTQSQPLKLLPMESTITFQNRPSSCAAD